MPFQLEMSQNLNSVTRKCNIIYRIKCNMDNKSQI